jgi:hypothetical protein
MFSQAFLFQWEADSRGYFTAAETDFSSVEEGTPHYFFSS